MTPKSRYYHTFSIKKGKNELIWSVERLWKLSKGFVIKKMDVNELLEKVGQKSPWFKKAPSIKDMEEHAEKLLHADTSKPIILNDRGNIMDGYHRLLKASALKHNTIRYVQFKKDPDPDCIRKLTDKEMFDSAESNYLQKDDRWLYWEIFKPLIPIGIACLLTVWGLSFLDNVVNTFPDDRPIHECMEECF